MRARYHPAWALVPGPTSLVLKVDHGPTRPVLLSCFQSRSSGKLPGDGRINAYVRSSIASVRTAGKRRLAQPSQVRRGTSFIRAKLFENSRTPCGGLDGAPWFFDQVCSTSSRTSASSRTSRASRASASSKTFACREALLPFRAHIHDPDDQPEEGEDDDEHVPHDISSDDTRNERSERQQGDNQGDNGHREPFKRGRKCKNSLLPLHGKCRTRGS